MPVASAWRRRQASTCSTTVVYAFPSSSLTDAGLPDNTMPLTSDLGVNSASKAARTQAAVSVPAAVPCGAAQMVASTAINASALPISPVVWDPRSTTKILPWLPAPSALISAAPASEAGVAAIVLNRLRGGGRMGCERGDGALMRH